MLENTKKRKCIRCKTEMIENLDLKVDGMGYGLKIGYPDYYGPRLEKAKVAICPKCGFVEIYATNLNLIKEASEKTTKII